jgi:hypothetical protein
VVSRDNTKSLNSHFNNLVVHHIKTRSRYCSDWCFVGLSLEIWLIVEILLIGVCEFEMEISTKFDIEKYDGKSSFAL